MAETAFPLIDAREILRVVGGAAFTRGKGYANASTINGFGWDGTGQVLSGQVFGTETEPYRTMVRLADKKGAWTIASTTCSCPVGSGCKHAAALLIYSNALHLQAKDVFFRDTAATAPAWQESLTGLLATAKPAARAHGADRLPLQQMALQFDLQDTTIQAHRQWAPGSGVGRQVAAAQRWRLGVRPMVRSGNGRWVRGNLRWNTISFKTYGLNLDAEQHRWFCQFVPLYRANGQLYFGEDNDWLFLDEFSSPLLWPLLEETAALGIELTSTQPGLHIEVGGTAGVSLAAAGSAAGIELAPTVALDGTQLTVDADLPAGAIGNHGVYALDGVALRLAPTGRKLDSAELELLHRRETVTVPASDVPVFLAKIYPRLGRRIAVASPDASVELPAILPPKLKLSVRFEADTAHLAWDFDYGPVSVEADTRDTAAEAALEQRALAVLAASPVLETQVLARARCTGWTPWTSCAARCPCWRPWRTCASRRPASGRRTAN